MTCQNIEKCELKESHTATETELLKWLAWDGSRNYLAWGAYKYGNQMLSNQKHTTMLQITYSNIILSVKMASGEAVSTSKPPRLFFSSNSPNYFWNDLKNKVNPVIMLFSIIEKCPKTKNNRCFQAILDKWQNISAKRETQHPGITFLGRMCLWKRSTVLP